jgi:2-phospho-L-lactate guanylyltransferase
MGVVGTWALVPVKPFRLAKQRLGGVLSPSRRATLARVLMMHTLDVLGTCVSAGQLARVLVVSTDPMALGLARGRGAIALREPGDGLNAALAQARAYAQAQGAQATLVVPVDLPALSTADVTELLALTAHAGVVVAPSYDGGTNALFTCPPDALHYAYGPASCAEHIAQAETSGCRVEICRAPGFTYDLDTPHDLARWLAAVKTRQPEPRAS